jgi:hypothetical protein
LKGHDIEVDVGECVLEGEFDLVDLEELSMAGWGVVDVDGLVLMHGGCAERYIVGIDCMMMRSFERTRLDD